MAYRIALTHRDERPAGAVEGVMIPANYFGADPRPAARKFARANAGWHRRLCAAAHGTASLEPSRQDRPPP